MGKCIYNVDGNCFLKARPLIRFGDMQLECNDCNTYHPVHGHKMIACSDECMEHRNCDVCKYSIPEYFYDQNDKIFYGGPIGCALHKEDFYQMIAEDCGWCGDFHCSRCTKDNRDKWVIKEYTDEEYQNMVAGV